MIGGSGGGGGYLVGGSGGGGAILIAASNEVVLADGAIYANGADCRTGYRAGCGSGGAIRIITDRIRGRGILSAVGGVQPWERSIAGAGRIRIDALENVFFADARGEVTRGFQPTIIPPANHAATLMIQNVGGVEVPANPSASATAPDVIVPSLQQNPVSIVVRCFNIPLNTEIVVELKPANGPAVRAAALNIAGTQASSTAVVPVTMPRGSGTLMARTRVPVESNALGGFSNPPVHSDRSAAKLADLPYSVTGLTTDGERIAAVEVEATLGGGSRTVYVTESGKRIPAPTGK